MKRAILGLLATASLVILSMLVFDAFDLNGATRILLSGGAGLILVTSLDGLRTEMGQTHRTPAVTPPAMPTRPTAAPEVQPSASKSDERVIDLRHHDDPKGGERVVEQLLADGELSRTTGPISDDDVPRIMMAALVD